jgi:hypothetical protein
MKKAAKVTKFMTQNAGDAATFGPRKLDTLAKLMQSLREQLGRMKVAWDKMRGADMENETFERIQKMVDESVDSGTDVLDRASQFMHEQETARQTRPRAKIQAAVSSTIPFARLRS